MQAVDSGNQERAERLAWHMDWLIRTEMKCFPELVMLSDRIMQKGFAIVKTVYEKRTEPRTITIMRNEMSEKIRKELQDPDQETILTDPSRIDMLFEIMANIWGFDRNDQEDAAKMLKIATEFYKGTDVFEFSIDVTVYDAPKIIVLDPEFVTVPVDTNSMLDLEKARWIDVVTRISPQELWRLAEEGEYNIDTAKKILEKHHINPEDLAKSTFKSTGTKASSWSTTQKDIREGIKDRDTKTNSLVIHEMCTWYDEDGDGKEERHVLEYCEDYLKDELKFIPYPYDMLGWPYVKVPFEITDDRHYSPRGSVEIQKDIADALDIQENQKINRQTLETTPTLAYSPSKFNPKNMTFIPGQPVAVEGDVDKAMKWLLAPGSDSSYIMEEAALKMWGEEMISGPDIASPLNVVGKNKMSQHMMQQISSDHISTRQLDLQIFQAAWALIFEKIWSLHIQFGPDVLTSYADEDNTLKQITKSEMFGKFLFTCGGRFGASNPILEAQKAANRIAMFRGDPRINQRELYRDYLAKQDPRLAKRLLIDEQQVQMAAQSQKNEERTDALLFGKKPKQVQPKAPRVTGGQAGQHNANTTGVM
jgi:hypothetical protein